MKIKDKQRMLIAIPWVCVILFMLVVMHSIYRGIPMKSANNVTSVVDLSSFDTSDVSKMFKDIDGIDLKNYKHTNAGQGNTKQTNKDERMKHMLDNTSHITNFPSEGSVDLHERKESNPKNIEVFVDVLDKLTRVINLAICILLLACILSFFIVFFGELFQKKKEKETNIKELAYEAQDRLIFIDNLLANKKYSASDISNVDIESFPLSSCVQKTDMLQIFELLKQLDKKHNEDNPKISLEDYEIIHTVYEKVLAKNREITDKLIKSKNKECLKEFFAIADEISKAISNPHDN